MSSVTETVADTRPQQAKLNPLDALPFSVPGITCIVLGYAPLMFMHFWSLWSKEQYQYFPFVLLAFGLLLYTRFREGDDPQPTARSGVIARYGYVIAWVMLATATLFQSAWLAAVSLNVLLAAVLAGLSHVRKIQNLWGIWFLLWLLIPLPLGVDTTVVVRLQRFSSQISSAILDMSMINHLMTGNVLQLPDKQFFVDEACSGIVSIMAVIACGTIYAVWQNRSPLHIVLLICSGVIWAIALNVTRICVIAIGHAWWEIDLSQGRPHEALGIVLFVLTFVALISTDRILDFLLRPIEFPGGISEQRKNPLVALWNNFTQLGDPKRQRPVPAGPSNEVPPKVGLAASSTFALLGAVSLVPITFATQTTLWSVEHAQTVEADFLPKQLGTLIRTDFESIHRPAQHELGDNSKTFTYHDPESKLDYFVSFDFPFSGGWHELCVCYKNTGWTLQRRKAAMPELQAVDPEWPIVAGEFTRDQEFGFVAFSNFNADAEGLSPPTDLIFWRPWRRMRRRLLKTFSSQTFQVQVWVSSEEPITDETKQIVEATLIDARQRFRNHFKDGA